MPGITSSSSGAAATAPICAKRTGLAHSVQAASGGAQMSKHSRSFMPFSRDSDGGVVVVPWQQHGDVPSLVVDEGPLGDASVSAGDTALDHEHSEAGIHRAVGGGDRDGAEP